MENNSNWLTIDKIIEKFIPVVWAIFLTVWLCYLLYTSVWQDLDKTIRLWLWFFMSLVVIGWAFSFSDRLRYFADVTIGAWILLLYWTLIYWSRTTDMVKAATDPNYAATIPEYATLITAFLFIIAICYFASLRKSKVILILWMIGSYITPFVIGQNDSWVQEISYNAYLTYFAAVNIVIFIMWREISIRDTIPLNIWWLFFGSSTLYFMYYTREINKIDSSNFFSSEIFTAILFFVLVLFSIWSILLSAKKFEEKDEWFLALWYIAPVLWFILNLSKLSFLQEVKWWLYILLWASCFFGWHFLRATKTRFQHVALYASGILCMIIWFFAFVPDLNVYSSIAIAYASLIFWVIFVIDSEKWERFVSYILLSFMWAVLSMMHIFDSETWITSYRTLFVIIALLPAIAWYFIASRWTNENRTEFAKAYSVVAFFIAIIFFVIDIFKYFNPWFLIFYIPSLIILINIYFSSKQSHEMKSWLLRASLIFFAFWFVGIFLSLVNSLYPSPQNTSLLPTETDWLMIKWIFWTIILFLWLFISRTLQRKQNENRPSFLLVIFGYSSLLLIVNYMIFALMNDMQISMEHWWPRALFTTIWWVTVAIFMLLVGIKKWSFYRSEKLLWLLLLAITISKIMLYDLTMMEMKQKIIILMIVGGILMLFSYWVHTKWLLKKEEEKDEDNFKTEDSENNEKVQEKVEKSMNDDSNEIENFVINKKIKDIDISNIESIILEPIWQEAIMIETNNLRKIVVLIIDNVKKTTFLPNELKNIYTTVLKNYKTSLSEEDYDTLKNNIDDFVMAGWEVKIIKK